MVYSELRQIQNGLQQTENGLQRTENGLQRTENGLQRTEAYHWIKEDRQTAKYNSEEKI